MFIRCSRSLSLIFPPTAYDGHVLLPLLLGKERLIWSVAHVNAVGTCPNVLEYTSLPDSTLQLHAATIPGIKLSNLVHCCILLKFLCELNTVVDFFCCCYYFYYCCCCYYYYYYCYYCYNYYYYYYCYYYYYYYYCYYCY